MKYNENKNNILWSGENSEQMLSRWFDKPRNEYSTWAEAKKCTFSKTESVQTQQLIKSSEKCMLQKSQKIGWHWLQ